MGQGGGNGGVVGVGWGNVWSNVGRSAWVAAVVVGQKSRGEQGRAGRQGRGRMGGDSSRKWGEQKGPKKSPPPHHCSRIGREKGQKKE